MFPLFTTVNKTEYKYNKEVLIMKKAVKIGIGIGISGITGLSIITILKRRRLARQAFNDAEFGEETVDDVESSVSENNNQVPEFTEYTGVSVKHVSDMLNAVTHKCEGFRQYYIKADDFEEIRKSLGVYQMFIRDNYEIIQFSNERNVGGEMITFRLNKNYAVSNDGWFIIDGKWTYRSKDETVDDYVRCAQGKERVFITDNCSIR
jgi:hypothetical protein